MAERIVYEAGQWTPGDPLYRRPRGSSEGTHIRPIAQLMHMPVGDVCSCTDRAEWPQPLDNHNLDGWYHGVPRSGGDAA